VKVQNPRWRHLLPAKAILAVSVALFPKALSCQAVPQLPRQDFETRTYIDAAHSLSKNTDFLLGGGLHISRDQGHIVYRRLSTGFAFHWRRFLTAEPYYQYSYSDEAGNTFQTENRLAFATTVGAPLKHWELSDRNLGERRFIVNKQEWRYRNRLEFRHPVSIERRQLSVFVWDEVSYSSRAGRWYRNRLALGASRKLTRRVSIEAYYLHQNDGFSRPGNLDGIEMTLMTRF
jgi:Protein of unknown function (DUF2490)